MEDAIRKNENSLLDPVNTAESSSNRFKNIKDKYKLESVENFEDKIIVDNFVDDYDDEDGDDDDDDVDSQANDIIDERFENKKQSYMFGKMAGSRWVTKKDQKNLKEPIEKLYRKFFFKIFSLKCNKIKEKNKKMKQKLFNFCVDDQVTKSIDLEMAKVLPKPNIALINSQLLGIETF